MTTAMEIPIILGYQLSELLYYSPRTKVYRGIQQEDSQTVVIKMMASSCPSFNELMQFRNQYTIARNLNIPGVVCPQVLKPYGNGYILVMEDAGEISLREYAQTNSLSLVEFLGIAIQLSEILHSLNQSRVIHKDIKPANILIHPQAKRVKLIDFSIASLLPRETQEIKNPNILEGTLAYISPEQTGRMNRGIDYRSDFYSLGVTFYELLTGELPFNADDPMELVHCHIAKKSPNVVTVNSDIPIVISSIIEKLMAKNASDRYQSALGLKYDLERCLYQLKETGKVTYFEIGQRDLCDRFLIPDKLYGREGEVGELLAAFEWVCQGNSQLMLVAGFSGIGKTAVVNEVHKPIVKQRGYFIKGKFDQFNRNIPFSAFVQALRDLMGQLLSESDGQLSSWKDKILQAVGSQGQIIIDVIPELELIIGQQPPITELSATAAQNRFNLLFQKFLQVFTTPDHPLVIFLDDLQWADVASLKLMQLLMGVSQTGYLLMIGAYRDNEVWGAHPLMLTLDEVGKIGAKINTITLKPLAKTSLNELVGDTLCCRIELAQTLTNFVYEKTQGNPFFATQFLKALHDDGVITFNQEVGYWQCDMIGLRDAILTSDVVEFMATQLQKLPQETQDILKLAACIGNKFDLETLAIICQQSQAEAATALWKALQEEFVLPQSQVYKFYLGEGKQYPEVENTQVVNYRFLHDRIQQAAYSLIPEDKKQVTHFNIGQLLLKNVTVVEEDDRIFDIVNHLNYGIELINEVEKRSEIAKLNLIAGTKAKASTAYTAAIEYATTGIKLLNIDCWQSQYDLVLALYNLAAEAAYLAGNLELMEECIQIIMLSAENPLDKVKLYEVKIQAYGAQNKSIEAVNTAKEFLKLLEVEFPETISDDYVIAEIKKNNFIFADNSIEDLINLPLMTEEKPLAIMQILSCTITLAYQVDSHLFILIALKQFSLSNQHGNAPISSFCYVAYGFIICELAKDIDSGYEFGKLAVNLLNKFSSKEVTAKVIQTFNASIRHLKEHIQETLQPLLEAYSIGLETGDLEFAALSIYFYGCHLYFLGQELSGLQKEMETYRSAIQKIQQKRIVNHHEIFRKTILNLLGDVDNLCTLNGEAYHEDTMLLLSIESNDTIALINFYFCKLQLSYLFGEYHQIQEYITKVEQYLSGALGVVIFRQCHFYTSLARLSIYQDANGDKQTQLLEKVIENQERMQMWANHCPMNVLHQYHLVEAEKYRVLGHKTEAMEYYDYAITGAIENGYIQEEALANELAAKFYLDWGKQKVASAYMQSAYNCYARWGAKAKVIDLEQKYPQLLAPILQPTPMPSRGIIITQTTSNYNSWFDFAAVMKAAQAISEEIELEKLLTTLMEIVITNAGAQIGHLILWQDSQWVVVATGNQQQSQILEIPLDKYQQIPHHLISSIPRTQQVAIFENLSDSVQFAADPYIINHQPKSVLCTPISHKGKHIGILYLENNLTIGAFTDERVEIIKLLTNQAAISLENARLYQQIETYSQTLEVKVEQKTQALNQKAEDLELALKNLQQTQAQLIHTEKMSSLGQLVAGIAHEINNPVNFIKGNLTHIQNYMEDIISLVELYDEEYSQPSLAIKAKREEIDIDFLQQDATNILESIKLGSNRISQIVLSLRNFSRLDEAPLKEVDLHSGIESTLLILQNRFCQFENKPEIQLVKEYGNLPTVSCYPSQLNQVFLNILNNAIDAIRENPLIGDKPQIRISTEVIEDSQIQITIANTNSYIPPEIQKRIFEPFFTTKPIGRGAGLGLFTSYSIVKKHGGDLILNSQLQGVTKFIISIPIM
jgi:predicted ATPase/signal transduction histidine kinase